MDIFIDTSRLQEIRRWLATGIIDGVTTNPSIMLREGVTDVEAETRAIAAAVGIRPVSVEVVTNAHDEMLKQARQFARLAPNIVVKIPIVNEAGDPSLEVVHQLEQEGIRVNVTACLAFAQVMVAAKAGATYASLFWGRIADEGNDASVVVRNSRTWLDASGCATRIIVGSIRGVIDIQQAALAGAHVITIPPAFLAKLADHKYSRHTAGEFVRDGLAALKVKV